MPPAEETEMLNRAVSTFAALAVVLTTLPVMAQQQRPNYPPEQRRASTYVCGSEIGHLPRVYPEQIEAVTDQNNVWVNVICADAPIAQWRGEGNADRLMVALEANDVIVAELGSRDLLTEDIVAVRMTGEETVLLYVLSDPDGEMNYRRK
jgi:hypothetical protein